jgi:hypothetical protein
MFKNQFSRNEVKMKKSVVLSLVVFCVAFASSAGDAVVTLPATPDISLTTSLVLKKNERIRFKKISVDDKTKYTLSFNGKLDGLECLEDNPRLELTLMPRSFIHDKIYDFLPKMRLEFFDAENKSLGISNQRSLPFGATHKYNITFYPLPGSKFVELMIQAGGNTETFKIGEMSFVKTPDQGAININPVVAESGFYDYSAWRGFATGSGLIRTKTGKAGFNPGYGSFGSKFPLKPNTQYVGSGSGTVLGYAVTLKLQMFDENGKFIEDVKILSKKGVRFTTPKNCVSGGIHVRSFVLEEVRVNEVSKGDVK